VQFDDLTGAGYLPRSRAQSCVHEYAKVAEAFRKEISPHIDGELAQQVLETNWLAGPVLRTEPRGVTQAEGANSANVAAVRARGKALHGMGGINTL
jgi:hypothetical protein